MAQYNIGVMYDNGYGVKEDKAEAIRWWKRAARNDYESAQKKLTELGENW